MEFETNRYVNEVFLSKLVALLDGHTVSEICKRVRNKRNDSVVKKKKQTKRLHTAFEVFATFQVFHVFEGGNDHR